MYILSLTDTTYDEDFMHTMQWSICVMVIDICTSLERFFMRNWTLSSVEAVFVETKFTGIQNEKVMHYGLTIWELCNIMLDVCK